MSFWSWMLLLFLLPVAGSLDVENWLTPIVETIRTEYNITEQFCAAVNIPTGQDPNQLLTVLQNDRYEASVKPGTVNESVYIGTRVVAAARNWFEHAEVRVLHNMDSLIDQSENNFLVFYTYLSPCAPQCANPHSNRNILNDILEISHWWGERHALVFGEPCTHLRKHNITREELEYSLKQLNDYGFKNIFRCYAQNSVYRCINCFSGKKVVSECLEGAKPQHGGKRDHDDEADISTAVKRCRVHSDDESISSSGSSSRSSSGSSSRSSSGSSSRGSSRGNILGTMRG